MAAFVLFPHPQRAEAHKVSRALAEAAVAAGLTPVVPAEHSAIFQSLSGIEFRSGHDLGAGCSFTASVGGDGSLLHAFAQVPDLPMVGIHAGELGYLTTVLPDDIDALVAAAVEERLEFVDLSVLDVTYEGETILALNDAVIAKGPDGRAPKLRLRVDGLEVVTMLADAMVLATPTGSTGYSFSARGPVVSRELAAVVVTPVAPHTLWDRSFVLGTGVQITVELVFGRSGILMVDGSRNAELPSGALVEVAVSDKVARLLSWGRDTPVSRLRRLTDPAREYDV